MIVQLLIRVMFETFSFLTSSINVDKLPESVMNALSTGLEYISAGFGIVGQFTDFKYLLVLFSIILYVDIAIMAYKIVMWVLKKIPFLGIK